MNVACCIRAETSWASMFKQLLLARRYFRFDVSDNTSYIRML